MFIYIVTSNQYRFMDSSLTIKIVAYLFITFIACYFYVENFKSYSLRKKIILGLVILSAISFGVWDIVVSLNSNKNDKAELRDTNKKGRK